LHGKSAVPASRIALLTGLLLLLLGASLTGAAQKETRVALVIGNSAYRHTPPLPNPRNDASDIAGALKRLGFDTLLEVDLDKRGMDEAFRRFARLARDADAALFFYAGHAMSFAGVNYLMPTDARLQDEADLPYEMAKVDDVISDLARARNVRILILDACRDNPLVERLRMNLPATRSAAVARGNAGSRPSSGRGGDVRLHHLRRIDHAIERLLVDESQLQGSFFEREIVIQGVMRDPGGLIIADHRHQRGD
jgi:hypothetical protein